ncbi:hypothetical protein EV363DRAFT_1187859 [Boletus edulis]|nr:hypothetical protein EV363DRAFT_1187859 [Boletus edulis]
MYYCIDRTNRKLIKGDLREHLSSARITDGHSSLGRLPLVPGMPVLITENLSIGCKIVNGTEGVLKDILYKESFDVLNGRNVTRREAVCAYVEVQTASIEVPGLPPSIVPIFPISTHFKFRTSRTNAFNVSRTQLPILPGWAFTDYKVQGSTMEAAVIDLSSAHAIQNSYVMLSRAKSLSSLGVLRWFPSSKLCSRLPQDLRNELRRIDMLDEDTRTQFQHSRETCHSHANP